MKKVLGEFDDGRLNIDGASLKEVLEAPSSKKNKTVTEEQASNFMKSVELREKNIATLTHVSTQPISTV